jgi:hypothetical protein
MASYKDRDGHEKVPVARVHFWRSGRAMGVIIEGTSALLIFGILGLAYIVTLFK